MDVEGSLQSNDMDITGLTMSQKTVLIALWGLLKKDIKLHSKFLFVMFFEDYPLYLSRFDFGGDQRTKLADNRLLHTHSLMVLNSLGTLIEFGLKDKLLFESTLNKIVMKHKILHITKQDVQNFGAALQKYTSKAFVKHKTKSVEDAINILIDCIGTEFEK